MTQTPLPYYPAPPGLRENIQAALRRPSTRAAGWRRVSWVAGIAAALVLVSGTWLLGTQRRRTDAEFSAVLDGHLRSVAPGHLTDVTSTDQHTVKPWFVGKLDFSPPVVDPAAEGFPLVGGRVDVMEGRSVAALVYSRRSHIINLFVRPTDAGGTGPHATVIRGYNIVSWSVEGMQFWAVSDLNLTELEQFQRFVSPPNTAL